tara:strand:- start:1253 stop:1453 length:201 start_codon:yes stop_codon:yes gene_type:complete
MKITKTQLRQIIKEEIGRSEEDAIQEVFHKYFAMAQADLEKMGIMFDDLDMVNNYIKMSLLTYRGK